MMHDRRHWRHGSVSQFSTISGNTPTWDFPPPFEGHTRRDSDANTVFSEQPPAFVDDRPPPYKRVVFNVTSIQQPSLSPQATTSSERILTPDTDGEEATLRYARARRRLRASFKRSLSSKRSQSSMRSGPESNSDCQCQGATFTDPNSPSWSKSMLDNLLSIYLSDSRKRKCGLGGSHQPRKSIPFDHPVYDMTPDEQVKLRRRGIDPVAVAEMKASGRPTPV